MRTCPHLFSELSLQRRVFSLADIGLGRISLATARLRSTFACLPEGGQGEWFNSGSKAELAKAAIGRQGGAGNGTQNVPPSLTSFGQRERRRNS